MISHEEFGQLRLHDFIDPDLISERVDWEFMDRMWIGEAHGFSEWLRLEDDPETLRSLAIDFQDFPAEAALRVLREIGLPLQAGMPLEELIATIGEPKNRELFVDDRLTYNFQLGSPDSYDVSCTVLNDGGLRYLVVMVPLS